MQRRSSECTDPTTRSTPFMGLMREMFANVRGRARRSVVDVRHVCGACVVRVKSSHGSCSIVFTGIVANLSRDCRADATNAVQANADNVRIPDAVGAAASAKAA